MPATSPAYPPPHLRTAQTPRLTSRLTRRAFDLLASLRLTVLLFALSCLVVFLGTLAQVRLGIDQAIEVYFRSWLIPFPLPGTSLHLPLLPGGWTLVSLLLLNLTAAWSRHFRPSWRQAGIWLSHAAVFTLLGGELLIGTLQKEWVLPLDVGSSSNEVQAYRHHELVLTAPDLQGNLQTFSTPSDQLRPGTILQWPGVPYQIEVLEWLPHAIAQPGPAEPGLLPQGIIVHPEPPPTTMGSAPEPAARLKLTAPSGASLQCLVSPQIRPLTLPGPGGWTIALRFTRTELPFTLHLHEFIHEKHPGTEIPRRFASKLTLTDTATGETRPVIISMNEPLRRNGWTLYQQSFGNQGQTSILHAVQNPARWLPYLGCALAAIGLAFHFTIRTAPRLRATPATPPATSPGRRLRPDPWFIAGCTLGLLAVPLFVTHPPPWQGTNLAPLLAQPVIENGRLKPLDTVARSSLLLLHGKTTLKDNGQSIPAGTWLAELLFRPDQASHRPVFRIENPEVLRALGFDELTAPAHLSFEQLEPHLDHLTEEARTASNLPAAQRSRYQRDILRLFSNARLYLSLAPSMIPDPLAAPRIHQLITLSDQPDFPERQQTQLDQLEAWSAAAGFLAIPGPNPNDLNHWRTPAHIMTDSLHHRTRLPSPTLEISGLTAAAATNNPEAFQTFLQRWSTWSSQTAPGPTAAAAREVLFNRANLFPTAMLLYIAALLTACFHLIRPTDRVRRLGLGLATTALLLHSLAIAWRMLIENRPPVTNLYSSAVFVGWAAAAFGLILEALRRRGTGLAVAGAGGFCSLLIAHHLALGGDTMEAMRAVLDSNFWLATHVVTITLGYSAVFVAGFTALITVLRSLFNRPPQPEDESMVVAATAVGLFLSFVGTVLGGIWADQSWGRFWGWDPKENGALLIVLWTALILHARLAGLARRRGTLALAIFGNIVVAWSWFGTNMLGIGLHSYGFMDAAFFWLLAFAALNLALIPVAFLPARRACPPHTPASSSSA